MGGDRAKTFMLGRSADGTARPSGLLEAPCVARPSNSSALRMSSGDDLARLLKEAAASMKSDVRSAVAKLESAYAIAQGTGNADDAAVVAEELARGWGRR